MNDIDINLTIKVWAAFSPGGLFKLCRNNENECWQRLCELQGVTVAQLKKRGYRVRPAMLDLEAADESDVN